MKIIIFGSTGATGLQLVAQALERGHQVVAFARDPRKIALSHPALELVQGDVLDYEAVYQATAGAEAAVSALGVAMGQPVGTVRSVGTQHIVKALSAQGVKRFVAISAIGVGDSLPRISFIGRLLIPRLIGAERLNEAEKQEQIVRNSSLAWTLVRPPRLVDGAGSGRYQIGLNLQTGLNSQLNRADLATAVLDQLGSDQFLRACPSVIN